MALLVLACFVWSWKPRIVRAVSVGVRWDYIYKYIFVLIYIYIYTHTHTNILLVASKDGRVRMHAGVIDGERR